MLYQVLGVANFFGKRFFCSFCSLSPHFVVFVHGERDLSSLPCLGEVAVQMSLKIEECCLADVISTRMTQYWKEPIIRKNSLHKVGIIWQK